MLRAHAILNVCICSLIVLWLPLTLMMVIKTEPILFVTLIATSSCSLKNCHNCSFVMTAVDKFSLKSRPMTCCKENDVTKYSSQDEEFF